jgi:D-alanine-D-alanine ligase
MTNMDPARFGKVAVLMGGWSAEREISLLSGGAVLKALQSRGVNASGIDVGRDVDRQLREGGFDRAFNMLHGIGGEDGLIQGVLELLQLPFTGSGITASALSMDKELTKRVWQSAGIPTPDFVELTIASDWQAVVAKLGLPLIVKPAREGSSIGMTRVTSVEQLPAAFNQAVNSGGRVFAEKWIRGGEYTVAIVDSQALPLIRIQVPGAFYDFNAKYQSDDTQYLCPCDLDFVAEDALQKLSLEAFEMLGCRGWGRVDLMLDENGKPYLIEVNTVPGMTSHSLVPKAAAAIGIGFESLVMRILGLTLEQDATIRHQGSEVVANAR